MREWHLVCAKGADQQDASGIVQLKVRYLYSCLFRKLRGTMKGKL